MAQALAQFNNVEFPPFADRKQLAANGTHFCIDEVKQHTQKDGKTKWYLTIRYDDGHKETLTFDIGAKPRDEKCDYMMSEASYPYHSCFVKAKPLPGKPQPFYNIFQEPEQLCSCKAADELTPPADDSGWPSEEDAPPPDEERFSVPF